MSVREKVITFVVSELEKMFPGVPVLRAKQNMAVQFENYIVIDLRSETPIGNQTEWDSVNEKVYVKGLVQATLNIQSFGKGSVERLCSIQAFLELPSVVDRFSLANIATNYIGAVNDITGLMDGTNYQERASVDVTISYDRSIVDNPGWFDTVYVTGAVTHMGDSKPTKKNMKVNIHIKTDKEMK